MIKSPFNDVLYTEFPSAEQHDQKTLSTTTQDDLQRVNFIDDQIQHRESPGAAKKYFNSESFTKRAPLASSETPASQNQHNGNNFT